MSEIPQRLRDAIESHQVPDTPTSQHEAAWRRDETGQLAWVTREHEVWDLPPAGGPGDEVCRHLSEPGRPERVETLVLRRAVDEADATERWRRARDVLADWRAGRCLLSPAARFAIDPDGVGGEELAFGVRTFALRTPTLPPATHTNCHVLGPEQWLLVDPGSPYPDQQERLARVADRLVGRYGAGQAIVLTHHHNDHVSGVEDLRRRTGLPVWAHPLTAERLPFAVDRELQDADTLGPWQVLFTPGHAPGHICLWHAERRLAVVGDMVASVGTIVIDPSEGDMAAYLANLERLRALGARVLYPAHGPAVLDADARLQGYIRHRLWREARIAAALTPDPAPLDEVTRRAYTDVSPSILWLAARSALSHLVKLAADGRARADGERWASAD